MATLAPLSAPVPLRPTQVTVAECSWAITTSTFGKNSIDVRYLKSLKKALSEDDYKQREARLMEIQDTLRGGQVCLIFHI